MNTSPPVFTPQQCNRVRTILANTWRGGTGDISILADVDYDAAKAILNHLQDRGEVIRNGGLWHRLDQDSQTAQLLRMASALSGEGSTSCQNSIALELRSLARRLHLAEQ